MHALEGLARELFEEISAFPVVDCHEHLPSEPERVAEPMDAIQLFKHYCPADLAAAGMPVRERDEVFDASKPLEPRWAAFKPYLDAIRFGSYAYPAFAYAREVLGFETIDDATVGPISERLQADNRAGLYDRVLRDLCGIDTVLECAGTMVPENPRYFAHLFTTWSHKLRAPLIARLEEETGIAVHSLGKCVDALQARVAREKDKGCIAMKVGAAYSRSLDFADVTPAQAQRVFADLRRGVDTVLSREDDWCLEDYLLRREIEACIDLGLPVAIHTGYHASNWNDIRNARATELWHLLKSYPQARFDLFHGSFPYVSDMTVLGKYFPNVALNMCWMHILSPTVSRRALDEWLDTVPVTKIFAFGGDYRVVELVYGHLQLARENVAAVLAGRVGAGRMTRAQAVEVARLLFYENPRRWYGLA